MSRAPGSASTPWSLLLIVLACIPQVHAEEANPDVAAISSGGAISAPAPGEDFRRAIRSLESSQGAYASQLSEYLGSLGLNLQRRGEHREAVEAFKRGVHLARVNDGLYSVQQIPLLEREIASHVALGEYTVADERQAYLYRVQMHNFNAGSDRARAFAQQADWQYKAFRLGLDKDSYNRLISMWDLNNLALNDIVEKEGQTSPRLVAPLRGMLQAQYLISDYNIDEVYYAMNSSEAMTTQPSMNRFNLYRSQSFRKGESVAQAIYDIQASNYGADSPEAAEARALRGDWMLFHGQRQAAQEAYQQAVGELAGRADAEAQRETLFGQAVELPDDDTVRNLPPAIEPRDGVLVVQFSVSATGRVGDLERLDKSQLNDGDANRIMRTLRHTRFRPRLDESGPVDSEVVRAYAIN